jgi:hypothetical protein
MIMNKFYIWITFVMVCFFTPLQAMNHIKPLDAQALQRLILIAEINNLKQKSEEIKAILDASPNVHFLSTSLAAILKNIQKEKPTGMLEQLVDEISRHLHENIYNAYWFDQALSQLTKEYEQNGKVANIKLELKLIDNQAKQHDLIAKQYLLILFEKNTKRLVCAKLYEEHQLVGSTSKVLVDENKDMWVKLSYNYKNPCIPENQTKAFFEKLNQVRTKTIQFKREKRCELIDEIISLNHEFCKEIMLH